MTLPVRSALRTSLAMLFVAGIGLAGAACSDAMSDDSMPTRSSRAPKGDKTDESGDEAPSSPSGPSGSSSNGTPTSNGSEEPSSPTTGGSTPESTPTAKSFTVALDKTTGSMNLAEKGEYAVTLTSKGAAGKVALSVSGLPEGVKATFEPALVDLAADATATAKLILESATDAVPGAANLDVSGVLDELKAAAQLKVDILSKLVIDIPANIDALSQGATSNNPKTDAFGANPIRIKAPQGISAQNPVTVVFHNADSTPHQIHAGDNGLGFPHGRANIAAGGNEPDRKINGIKMSNGQPAPINFYLHDQGTAKTVGSILIVP